MPSPTTTPYRGCKVCGGERERQINDLLIAGTALLRIEREMRADGYAIKAESVGKHLRRCLRGDLRNIENGPESERPVKHPAVRDLAVLVHDNVVREVEAGRLRVSVRDGMTARALLDRRDEKKEERMLVMSLARLLSGAGTVGPMLDDGGEAIEAEFIELEDFGENPLLAPPEVREAVG